MADTLLDDQRSSDFINILRAGLHAVGKDGDPADLYAVLLYAYLCSNDQNWCETLNTKFDDRFIDFMRLELGMHRNEFELFEQTIGLLKQLIKHGDPDKLRARHRDHLATNRAFPLALTFARTYHHIEPQLVNVWGETMTSAQKNARDF